MWLPYKIFVAIILLFQLVHRIHGNCLHSESIKVRGGGFEIPSNSLAKAALLEEEEHNFFYALCEFDYLKNNVTCNVTVETYPFPEGTVKDTCKINLSPENKKRVFKDKFDIFPLAQDKIGLIFYSVLKAESFVVSSPQAHYTIVNMEDCTRKNFTIQYDAFGFVSSPMVYNRTVEIVAHMSEQCGGVGALGCRITFDFDGKQIDKPKWYHDYNYGEAVMMQGIANIYPYKGYYEHLMKVHYGPEEIEVFYMDLAGNPKHLFYIKEASEITTSDVYGLHGVCWHPNMHQKSGDPKKIRCVQADTKNVKFNITLEFEDDVKWMAVRNLQGGGMVIVVANKYLMRNPLDFEKFNILKIHADGRRDRILTISNVKESCYSQETFEASIFESVRDEYCFNFLCGEQKNMYYQQICIKKNHISFPYRSRITNNV